MSKRRKAFEVVYKEKGAGFLGVPCFMVLQPEEDREPCVMNCGDDDCTGWSNCSVIDRDGTYAGFDCYHVYECQMRDVDIYRPGEVVEDETPCPE